MEKADALVTIPGCPCGCNTALCPRCYAHYCNVCDGLASIYFGVLICHDCRMAFSVDQYNAEVKGRGEPLDAETIERRNKNRERLRPFGFQFDATQEAYDVVQPS